MIAETPEAARAPIGGVAASISLVGYVYLVLLSLVAIGPLQAYEIETFEHDTLDLASMLSVLQWMGCFLLALWAAGRCVLAIRRTDPRPLPRRRLAAILFCIGLLFAGPFLEGYLYSDWVHRVGELAVVAPEQQDSAFVAALEPCIYQTRFSLGDTRYAFCSRDPSPLQRDNLAMPVGDGESRLAQLDPLGKRVVDEWGLHGTARAVRFGRLSTGEVFVEDDLDRVLVLGSHGDRWPGGRLRVIATHGGGARLAVTALLILLVLAPFTLVARRRHFTIALAASGLFLVATCAPWWWHGVAERAAARNHPGRQRCASGWRGSGSG